jgi:hypothetical protein
MPVPGPRTQFGPEPGYRNPEGRMPDLFNQWLRPGPVWWPGRSPGTMFLALRGNKLGFGQIRSLWRQSVNYTSAFPAYSWTENGIVSSGSKGGIGITRALRYMTRSVYIGSGLDHSRFDELHTVVSNTNVYKTVTVNAGQKRNRPTVRNRLTSFGSRVPTLNQPSSAAQ